jgi:NAD(P)-dependent dehydrogenase (short-subunit alcohol dehydrogenase family)
VTDPAAVTAAVGTIERTLGPIDQAVLNAGSHQPVRATGLSAAAFRELTELNLMGTVNCLEALLPGMIARRAGRIAVVASLAGYRGLPTSAAYGMTKAGLINMAEALKPELEAYGVHMQVVNPGFVRTPLTDKNPFPMPFLMEVEDAAGAFYRGLGSKRFEIVFPRRLAYLLKVLRCLPTPLAFAVTRRLVPEP